MNIIKKLEGIRANTGDAYTVGLSNEVIEAFSKKDEKLIVAVDEAVAYHAMVKKEYPDLLKMAERELGEYVQQDFINFYSETTVNPYVAIAAKGPWIITWYGAVVHDSGGYGMLGAGHGPDAVLSAMSRNHVMANIMTPSLSQKRMTDKLKKEIGHTRNDGCPYTKFLCMNSGSESVTLAFRISDVNAKVLTDKGGRHEGKEIKVLSFKGGFHGRTDKPAHASDSSRGTYTSKLASFRDHDNLLVVEPNDVADLERVFAEAEKNGQFIEMALFEPCMGEGNPGIGITREFYDKARELTKAHGSLLLIDSIQAGIRAHGCLSVCDYPGFQDAEAPDLETYSKAVNAGQYPLSILAVNESSQNIYQRGIYGNTMTANPRALEVGCAVLDNITPELRKNIQDRGLEFKEKFSALGKEFPNVVTAVTGTGLLCAIHLSPEGYAVVGEEGVELYMRKYGIGVIHGGTNALRFTPHFNITSEEIDLICDIIRDALNQGPIFK